MPPSDNMKCTIFVSLLVAGLQLVSGTPFSKRAPGGTVVIRQFAQNSDAFVDTTVAIDLEGSRTPHALKSRSPVDFATTALCMMLTCFDSLFSEAKISAGNIDHI